MSRSKQLNVEQKDLIQNLLTSKSVSEVSAQLGVSRNTVYRWKKRQDTSRKSRRPKTNTASLLPVQRAVICELIRLSRWPKRELLPVVTRVFPVFKHVGEGGQRRLWKEVWGTGSLSPVQLNSGDLFYRSSFRVGALLVAQEGRSQSPFCMLVAWETLSGALVYRVIEGTSTDATDFLLDLCHEWPFQIEAITLLSTDAGAFPGFAGKHVETVPKVSHLVIEETFRRLWTKRPPLSQGVSKKAGPQVAPPLLGFEVCASRPQIIWLPPRRGVLDFDVLKRVARSWVTSHNTRLRGKRTEWLHLSRQVLTPEEYLIHLWESTEINGAVGDEEPKETRAALHLLFTQPLVMYSKNKRTKLKSTSRTSLVAKK